MTNAPEALEPTWREPAHFRTIFEQAPFSMQIFSSDGTTVAVNRAWETLWGVTLEQLGRYNILEDQQLVEKGVMPYIERAFAGESGAIPAIKYEPDQTVMIEGSVAYRWVRGFIYPVRDEGGTVREVVLTHEDITEQRLAEQALQESENRFRAMFYNAPVGISLIDPEGRYVAVNPIRQRMLGFTEAELIGKPYLDVTYEDDVEYDLEVNRTAIEAGEDRVQLEKRFVRKDGSVEWSRITAASVRDEDGRLLYAISIAEDITHVKRAEEERTTLLELERQARLYLEQLAAEREATLGQITEGIILADPSGQITFVNSAAKNILGKSTLGISVDSHSEVYGLFTMDGNLYPPAELPLTRAVRFGETVVNVPLRIRRDDREIVAEVSATPVVADDGTHLGGVVTMRDITSDYSLQKQKDEFLSAVAHDLRTPLTTIKGRVQMLRRRAEYPPLQPEQFIDSLTRIDLSATRMITLINDLLDVANIQLGRQLNLVRQPTDLVALARDVVREHQTASDRHTIIVKATIPQLIGHWDGSRLERVLANLLSNAIKYSPDGEYVTVEVRSDRQGDGDWAVLSVQDTGVGIPGDDLPQIFDRFHRGKNVTGKIYGTGIGLSVVRETVEQHGGSVTVKSQEAVGTEVIVRLPLVTQES